MVEPLRLDYAVNDSEVIAAFKRQQKEMETERKARGELQKQITDNANAQKTVDKAAFETSKMLSQQQAKLAADAAKIAEAVRTPMQQYKASLGELIDHYKSGRLTQDQYRAAVDKAKQSYQDQTGATERLKAAEVSENQEKREAAKLIEKLLTPQQKHAAAIKNISEMHKKGRLSIDQYNAALKAEGAELAKNTESGGGFSGMLGGLGGKLAGAAAGFMSFGAVITFIKNEYDALLERQGKSKDANITLAAEQEALLMNLGDADPKKVTDQIRDLSKQSGIKEQDVTRAVNEAMAARADLSVEDVMDGVATASKVRKFAPSELAGLSSAAIDTRKQTGLGTEESMGFLMQLQAQSRTKSLTGLAKNFTPAVGSVMQLGADRQTAGGMLAALSHGMADSEGSQSKTSAISLAKQLREYGKRGNPEIAAQAEQLGETHSAEQAAVKADYDKQAIRLQADKTLPSDQKAEIRRQMAAEEKVRSEALKKQQSQQMETLQDSAPAMPISQVIERMQQDKTYRDDFLKGKDQGGFGATFEAAALPSVESLLSGGTQAKQYASAKQALTADPKKEFERAIANRDLPSINLAAKDQFFENASDQMRLGDTKGAMSSIARTRLREMKDSMGKTSITSNLETVLADLDSGGVQSEGGMIRKLEDLKHGAGRAQVPMLDKVVKGMREEGINWEAPEGKAEFLRRADEQVTQSPVGQQEVLLGILIEQLKGMRTDNANQAEQNKNKVHVGAMVGRAREAGK